MPPRGQGPRLWRRPERRDNRGRISHAARWLILDGRHQESTRCLLDDSRGAEEALGRYIARKHVDHAGETQRDPVQVPVADALAIYARDVAPRHAKPGDTAARIERLLKFFGDKRLSQINGALCRAYAEGRSSDAAARRELEDLRSAVNHYYREGMVRVAVPVTLPRRRPARERWLTRAEAAQLLRTAWRTKDRQSGSTRDRHTRRHVARFIIVGLYAGRRAGAICEAALQPTPGRGWIDLASGVFHPRAGRIQTKKRQPAIPLPRRLLAHLRRWKKAGQRYVVEWNGAPIERMAKAFRHTVREAGLDVDVTPHTLRHTSATWMMQRGAALWAAAGYLGMSPETLARVYGHHHPDHLKAAWSVFDRPGGEVRVRVKPRRRKARRKPVRAGKRQARHRRAGGRK